MLMENGSFWWVAFILFVLALLALDVGVFHRKAHDVKLREALSWSLVWVTLALLFNLGIYLGWLGNYPGPMRPQRALEFLTGYVLEKSLSADNIFVFLLSFRYFRVPAAFQHKVLFWGIAGALIMRGTLIFAGIAFVAKFHWLIYVFGLFLIVTGARMAFEKDKKIDPEKNPMLKLLRRWIPVTKGFVSDKFLVRRGPGRFATPLFVTLLFVETTDAVFALDSVPAILAITGDPFIAFTSNVFAMLGLRAMYFALAGFLRLFHYLHYGLSAGLVFTGLKMLASDLFTIPTGISLGVIAVILLISVFASILHTRIVEVILPSRESGGQPAAIRSRTPTEVNYL